MRTVRMHAARFVARASPSVWPMGALVALIFGGLPSYCFGIFAFSWQAGEHLPLVADGLRHAASAAMCAGFPNHVAI